MSLAMVETLLAALTEAEAAGDVRIIVPVPVALLRQGGPEDIAASWPPTGGRRRPPSTRFGELCVAFAATASPRWPSSKAR
jgi:hypothetical protein